MRRVALPLLFLLLCLAGTGQAAWHSVLQTTVGAPACAGYSGPGDVTAGAAKPWYGVIGYNCATATTGTTKALNLCRTSDSTCQDFVILASGAFDDASAVTFGGARGTCTNGAATGNSITVSGCTATPVAGDTLTATVATGSLVMPEVVMSASGFSGSSPNITGSVSLIHNQTVTLTSITIYYGLYIATMYDQSPSGTNNCTASGTGRLQYVPAASSIAGNGGPYGQAAQGCTSGSTLSLSQPFAFSSVAQRDVNGGGFDGIVGVDPLLGVFANSPNVVWFYGGAASATAAATEVTLHAFAFIDAGSSGASSYVNVDGTPGTPGASGSGTASGAAKCGYGTTFNNYGYTYVCGYYAASLSSGDQTALYTLFKAKFSGIP